MNCIKGFLTVIFLYCAFISSAQSNKANPKSDWLLSAGRHSAEVIEKDGKELTLQNGLVRRTFRLYPNVVCYDFVNEITGQQLIRAVEPEARVQLDGIWYNVGGLHGQKERAYFLPEWLGNLNADPQDFSFVKYEISALQPLLPWDGQHWWAPSSAPAKGKEVVFYYASNQEKLRQVSIAVHYAIYDGLPLVSKWITVANHSGRQIRIDQIIHEQLALVEEESAVVGSPEDMWKQHGIYIESNFAFNNAMRYHLSDQTTHWERDSTYTSQVNYNYDTPARLAVYPKKGVGVLLDNTDSLQSIRSWELLMDSYDRERRGLAIRKMYRTIAPWTMANPIFMHLVSRNDEQVRAAIDQCEATGYEALILSFGSHINMEDTSAGNLQRWKSLADYAHTKGIKIGGYSLFSSRKISEDDDVINPLTGKTGDAFFGNAPCFGSMWGQAYSEKIKTFFAATGFDIWENDGPYPGDQCASTDHPGHHDVQDSQWKQFQMQKELYHWLNARGVYINSPDWYFLDGSHKIGLGYREVNFSLPRANQRILNRQNIYDGTWEQLPSMGWGFVPLTAYQGGGPEAVLEPLEEHIEDYKQLMVQYYGAGVQACYRGPRLYDTQRTKDMVIEVIDWYKKYRDVLNADIVHLRRADGRDWDGILHVDAHGKEKGFALFYNPLSEDIVRTVTLPLYYAGLHQSATIREQEGELKEYTLNRDYTVELDVHIPANGYTWYVIE